MLHEEQKKLFSNYCLQFLNDRYFTVSFDSPGPHVLIHNSKIKRTLKTEKQFPTNIPAKAEMTCIQSVTKQTLLPLY